MKIRTGLVSNSSSSSFVLDIRDEQVKKLVSLCQAGPPYGLSRSTAIAVGKKATSYARHWIEKTEDWYGPEVYTIARMILKWAKELGEENIVFMRESDEDVGGSLFDENAYENFKLVRHLALEEMEYH